MDDRRGGQPGGDQLQDRGCEFSPTQLEHAPLNDRRAEIALLVPGLGLSLRRAVSHDRFVLIERFRTIETLFTVFLRFSKIVFPIFGNETYQHLRDVKSVA
jgi:hypothetical protein